MPDMCTLQVVDVQVGLPDVAHAAPGGGQRALQQQCDAAAAYYAMTANYGSMRRAYNRVHLQQLLLQSLPSPLGQL
jgi:hypothetical protein